MIKKWLSNKHATRRLAVLLVMFLVLASGTLIYFQFFPQNLSVSADATPDIGQIRFPKTNITSIPDLLTKLVYIFLPAAGMWAVISLIWAGILYITAAGNTERAERAKKQVVWSITGIVIIAMSALIVYTFVRILTGNEPIPGTTSPGATSPGTTPSGAIPPQISTSPSIFIGPPLPPT